MYTQRARRIALPISIMYRRAGEEDWHPSKVVNLSESGGSSWSHRTDPRHRRRSDSLAADASRLTTTGKPVCSAEVVRATDVGAVPPF